jgi:SH3-like domain-containing protein
MILWPAVLCAAIFLSGAGLAAEKSDKKPLQAKPAAKAAAPETAKPAAKPTAPTESPPAVSDEAREDGPKSGGGNLPIPRFVSLRTDPVNLRAGPGPRYPIDWVYVRRHLPVEVLAEFDTWRRIRDPEGAEGWVHQSMLSGQRTAVIVNGPSTLRRDVNDQAPLVANLESGVVVNVQRCPVDLGFCRVQVRGLQGWLKREHLWGIYPNEAVQ